MTTLKKLIPFVVTVEPIQSGDYKTVLFNCNCHTFDAVITQIIRSIQCTREKAEGLAMFADEIGSVIIYEGSRERCEKVASVLGSIGLVVTVVGGPLE